MFRHVYPFIPYQVYRSYKCEIPKCETCYYTKAHRYPTNGSTPISKPDTDGDLKAAYTCPGDCVSVNHFESRFKGHTLTLFGQSSSEQYVGECILVDHESVYLKIEHQLGFSLSETIKSKHNFELLAMYHVVVVDFYLS